MSHLISYTFICLTVSYNTQRSYCYSAFVRSVDSLVRSYYESLNIAERKCRSVSFAIHIC